MQLHDYPFLVPHEPGCSRVVHPTLDLDIRFFAGPEVPVSLDAFEQLLTFTDVQRALDDLHAREMVTGDRFFGDARARIERIVLTPDFHKGSSGIPVGTVVDGRHLVIPRAIGSDVCCGMRLLVTDLPASALDGHREALERRLRALFFQGERDIPLSPRQREAMLRDGLCGLHETRADNLGTGAWASYDPDAAEDDLARVHANGRLPTKGLFGFESFVRSSGNVDGRDPQIGCVGGGNHFVELQEVERIYDGASSRALGLRRGDLAIMVHSGSVGLGHAVGGYFDEHARSLFPKAVRAPKGGFFPMPTEGPQGHEGRRYLDAMGNAGNFAFANRLFLGLVALRAVREATGRRVDARLVHDAPHNLVFEEGDGRCLHRKGATPAKNMHDTRHAWLGQPVVVPGSMGARSYVLSGHGNASALESASHGAGRALSRGKAARLVGYSEDLARLRVVTPIDPDDHGVKRRPEVQEKLRRRLSEEAPAAYKDIEPVVDSLVSADVAHRVASLVPLITVKG